jgi:GntR family transcriptional regulator, rspAB operon transcriptional repressor
MTKAPPSGKSTRGAATALAPAPRLDDAADRPLLKDVAHDRIKDLILTGALPPGSFLSERNLARDLGMSKTPIRFAIERLALEGFVAVSPRQGIVVRGIRLDEAADQFEIRIAIECHTVRRLAGRLTADQVRALEENLDAHSVAADARDFARARELDTDFHLLLSGFLGNREIQRVMERLREKLIRAISAVLQRQSQRMSESNAEHRSIVAALLAGDGEEAARRMEGHLEVGRRAMVSGG